MMVADHEETVEKCRGDANNGQRQEIRDWAAAKISNLEHHLEMAEKEQCWERRWKWSLEARVGTNCFFPMKIYRISASFSYNGSSSLYAICVFRANTFFKAQNELKYQYLKETPSSAVSF